MPYSVNLDEILKVIGSDAATVKSVVDRVSKETADEIESFDSDFEDEIDEGCPSALQAVEQILTGKAGTEFGFMYGYALKLLCETYGYMLENDMWSAISGNNYIDKVDRVLKEHGLDIVSRLMYRQLPIEYPLPDDFPAIGYLSKKEVEQAYSSVSFDALKAIPGDEGRSARQLYRWLEFCLNRGEDLVSFYH